MSLGSGERLLGDNQCTRDTHCLIFTIRILVPFQPTMANVGISGRGICSVFLNLRNNEVDVLNIVAKVCDVMTNVRKGLMWV